MVPPVLLTLLGPHQTYPRNIHTTYPRDISTKDSHTISSSWIYINNMNSFKIYRPFFACLLLISLVQWIVCEDFNSSEYSALKLLYDSTGGEYWTYDGADNGHWNFSDPNPCFPTPWQGLTCDSSNTIISEMSLGLFNLTGSLPGEVFTNLPELRGLYLYNNDLSGSIPESLGKLPRL